MTLAPFPAAQCIDFAALLGLDRRRMALLVHVPCSRSSRRGSGSTTEHQLRLGNRHVACARINCAVVVLCVVEGSRLGTASQF